MDSQTVKRRKQLLSTSDESWEDSSALGTESGIPEENTEEESDELHLFHRLVRFCNPRNSHGGFLDVANSALFVVCIVLTAISAVVTIKGHYRYDVVVAVSHEFARNLTFPAITICHPSPLKKSHFCNSSDPFSVARQHLCDPKLTRDDFVELFHRKYHRMLPTDPESIGREFYFNFSDVVKDCAISGRDCKPFVEVMDIIPRYGQCFCLFCRKPSPPFTGRLYQGVFLRLYNKETEFLPFVKDRGTLVMVHDRRRLPDMNLDGIFIRPKDTTYISLQRKLTTSLAKPYSTDCREEWPSFISDMLDEETLTRFYYTQESCFYICYNWHVVDSCGCESDFKSATNRTLDLFVALDTSRLCNFDGPVKLECRRKWQESIKSTPCTEKCTWRCAEIDYVRKTSSMARRNIPRHRLGRRNPERKVAYVRLYFETPFDETIAEIPKQQPRETRAMLGTFMSMYARISLCFVYEYLEKIFLSLLKRCYLHVDLTNAKLRRETRLSG